MKKGKRILITFIICYINFYLVVGILELTSLDKQLIMDIACVFFLLPIIVNLYITKVVIKREDAEITRTSIKVQKLIELNNSFEFKKVAEKKHSIVEREFSRKSLRRVTFKSVIRYHIENDIQSIRSDIESTLYNLQLFEKYNNCVQTILNSEYENVSKYSLKKFKRIEERVINNLIIKREDILLSLKVEIYYQSNGGRVYDNKVGKFSFDDLVNVYNEWKDGKKYAETVRQERKIMNDDIRYNVLKRDNYTCQICGATAKDGVKLHVDHIIPVSKGGKTVMSNLQTLCERCNLGKSNKIDDNDDMICPQCGASLIEKNGKYGKFIGCSNYPNCRYVKKK